MECLEYEVRIPGACRDLDQNEEWITVVTRTGQENVRLHDYSRFYEIPGLYEDVVYKRLKCVSPRVVCDCMKSAMDDTGVGLKVLDFGAGNGIVAEHLRNRFNCQTVVGLDIIPEARDAAQRDRPDAYDDYYVMDLSRIDPDQAAQLEQWKFNALVTVAALGYGDIPTKAFINAFNIIEPGGWVAFNIKEKFLSGHDSTGYRDTIEAMMGDSLEVCRNVRYCHRLSLAGEPLHYHAISGTKIKNVTAH